MPNTRLQTCFAKIPLLYKTFYFVFYAGYMSFLLYVPVYFKYLGLGAIYVGLLNGIRPLMQTLGAPLWGVIGDRFRIRKGIFVVAFVIMTVKTMSFLIFRPENTMCVVSYYNSSKQIIKNETYFVKHNIKRRSSMHDNIPNWKRMTSFKKANRKQQRVYTANKEASKIPYTFNFVNNNITPNNNDIVQKKPHKVDPIEDERTIKKNYKDHSVHYKIIYDDKEITNIFYSILILVICGEVFDAAVFTMADTSCLDTLGSENYGYYRLWGSAGWGVMSPFVGFLITQQTRDYCGSSAGSYYLVFYFYLGFMYLGLLLGSHFEFSYSHNDHIHKTVKSALLNFHYGVFLFVTFYAGVCYGFLLYFVNWFIDSLGGTAIIMGTAAASKSIVDVIIFFSSGRIINALGHLNTITISLIAYIGSFVSYAYMKNPWYAIPIEVLHASAYALVWSSSVSYLNKAAPAGSSATVQGILQGVYWGLGTGGGTIVGGYVVHVFGLRSTFQGFAVVTAVVLAIFLTTKLISKCSDLPEEDDANEEVNDDYDDYDDTWEKHWQEPGENSDEKMESNEEKEPPEEIADDTTELVDN